MVRQRRGRPGLERRPSECLTSPRRRGHRDSGLRLLRRRRTRSARRLGRQRRPSPCRPDYDQYVILRDRILLDARTNCVERADDLGFANNDCVIAIPDTDDIFSNGKSGECSYQELAIADTDGEQGTEGGPAPFDLTGLSCRSGTSCNAPQSLIDDMIARPEAFLLDSPRIVFDTDGSLVFQQRLPRRRRLHRRLALERQAPGSQRQRSLLARTSCRPHPLDPRFEQNNHKNRGRLWRPPGMWLNSRRRRLLSGNANVGATA